MATYCPEDLVPRELSCPICFEDYDISDPMRYPKLLLCLHTFCANCTRLLWRRDGTLECSMCRMLHRGVRLDELYDNHVIFTHLRQKLEERDLELARRIDQEMRSQPGDSHETSNTSVSVLTSNPAPAPARAVVCSPASPELVVLDSSVNQSQDDTEDEDNDVGDGSDRFHRMLIVPSVSAQPWEEDESTEDEDDPDDGVDAEGETEDDNSEEESLVVAEDAREAFENDDDDDDDDDDDNNGDHDDDDDDDEEEEEGVDARMQCIRALVEVITHDSDEDIDTGFEGDELGDGIGVGDDEEEDGWHSASEDCSPNRWNPHLSDDSEDVDDTSEVIHWNAFTPEAMLED